MSQQYLLPCSCGQSIVVQTVEAGQLVSCACGRVVEAPMLRVMRKLESIGGAAPRATRRGTTQVSIARIVFVLSLVGLVFGLLMSLLMSAARQQLDLGPSDEEMAKNDAAYIDTLPSDELWGKWQSIRSAGLGEQDPSETQRNRFLHKQMHNTTTNSLIAAGVFAALAVISAVFARGKSNPGNARHSPSRR